MVTDMQCDTHPDREAELSRSFVARHAHPPCRCFFEALKGAEDGC